jgi:hypothetical protein
MNNWCICWFPYIFILGILILKGHTARRLDKSFGVKGLSFLCLLQVSSKCWPIFQVLFDIRHNLYCFDSSSSGIPLAIAPVFNLLGVFNRVKKKGHVALFYTFVFLSTRLSVVQHVSKLLYMIFKLQHEQLPWNVSGNFDFQCCQYSVNNRQVKTRISLVTCHEIGVVE